MSKMLFGDCLEVMKEIPDKSVDMVFCDLPYGITQNKWDAVIPFEPLWKQYNRIIKDDGILIFTAKQPFTSALIMSNPAQFKHADVWVKADHTTPHKTQGSGQLNINHMPLQVHEDIVIFKSKKLATYNEQLTEGEPYNVKRKAFEKANYGKQRANSKKNDGYRHAKSVKYVAHPRVEGGHKTQKPVELVELYIKTYTNEGDVVLDNCIGSGTTAIACINLNREYIGIENDKDIFAMAKERIENHEVR